MPLFTSAQRDEAVRTIPELIREDAGVEGILLVGSMARQPDRWSDIDLSVVMAEDASVPATAAHWVRRLYETLPVVHHFETAFGDTLVRGLLLDNGLELDLAFESLEGFSVWGPARVLFDRSGRLQAVVTNPVEWRPGAPEWRSEAGFAWHDVLHACTAARRGRLWQALWYLQRIRNRTLGLAQERRGWYADFFDYVDDLPGEELSAMHATLVSSLDAGSLLQAIEVATRAFLTELRNGDPFLSERLEKPLLLVVSGSE